MILTQEQQMFTPFRPTYPLAIENPTKEDPNELQRQINALSAHADAYGSMCSTIETLSTSHDPETLTAIFPNYASMKFSTNAVSEAMTNQLGQLQKRRLSLIAWLAMSESEQLRQRDLLLHLDQLWGLIYKTGLRASTYDYACQHFSSSLISANIEDLKKNIEAEFVQAWNQLEKGIYLAYWYQGQRPNYMEEGWTLDQLWVMKEPAGVAALSRK